MAASSGRICSDCGADEFDNARRHQRHETRPATRTSTPTTRPISVILSATTSCSATGWNRFFQHTANYSYPTSIPTNHKHQLLPHHNRHPHIPHYLNQRLLPLQACLTSPIQHYIQQQEVVGLSGTDVPVASSGFDPDAARHRASQRDYTGQT